MTNFPVTSAERQHDESLRRVLGADPDCVATSANDHANISGIADLAFECTGQPADATADLAVPSEQSGMAVTQFG